MASVLSLARPPFKDATRRALPAVDVDLPRSAVKYFAVPIIALFLAPYCVSAFAGDIARNTPAASMALAEGMYAAPATSASVKIVTTPTVQTSALPPDPPPQKAAASAPSVVPVAPAAPVVVATAAAPTTSVKPSGAGWTNYVAIIAGIVGAITGIAGAIMGGLGLRKANRQARRS